MSTQDLEGYGFSRIKIVVFGLLFILGYGGLNSIIVLRLGGLLGVGGQILYLWIGVVSLSLPVAMYVERIHPNSVSRVFYTISTLWMGVLFFFVCTLSIYEVVSSFYTVAYGGVSILLVVSVLSIISVMNAIGIDVKAVDVPVGNLEKDVSIVQLSDIHLGTIRNSAFLRRVVEKAKGLDPDVVLITGDLIDGSARVHEKMFDEFDRFEAPVYFVTGNHEVYEGIEEVYSKLSDTKIRVLRNDCIDYEDLQIIGVEYSENNGHLRERLEELVIDEAKPSVLMYHSPVGVMAAKRAGIDLQLAGHTHAGQVFPFNYLVRLVFKHIAGQYDLGGLVLYVSAGTGTWGPYMRLGSRNEITQISLKRK